MAHYMAARAYGKGAIAAEQYFGRSNADNCLVDSSDNTLLACLRNTLSQKTIFILQHGAPSQDSCKARARSPDLKPIKNSFHVIEKNFHKDALQMNTKQEVFKKFSTQVKTILESVRVVFAIRTIQSMDERIDLIIKERDRE